MRSLRPALVAFTLLAGAPVLGATQGRAALVTASFAQLFDEYRRGDAAVAVEAFSRWPEKQVRAEGVLRSLRQDTATLVAFAAFHTEAGIANFKFGGMKEGMHRLPAGLGYWGLEKDFEPHSYQAYVAIVELLDIADDTGDGRLRDLARSWYIVAMSFCHRWDHFGCTQSLFEKGESLFNDDAEFRLIKGSVKQSTRMTRAKADSIPYFTLQNMAQLPRHEFKEALKRDPKLVEARIRLAHTSHALLNYPDAEEDLKQALDDARDANDVYGTYLAAFFLGELHEDARRLEEAAIDYQIAVHAQRAHTASVALGQALVRLGRRDFGLETGRLMFGYEGPGVDPVWDPYLIYHFAQSWQIPRRLEAMREIGRIK